jgi:hypothetical protein
MERRDVGPPAVVETYEHGEVALMDERPKLPQLVAVRDELLARLDQSDDPGFDELKADIYELRERVLREHLPVEDLDA